MCQLDIFDIWLKQNGYFIVSACIYRKNDIAVFVYPARGEIVITTFDNPSLDISFSNIAAVKELLQGKETYDAVRNSFEHKKIEKLLERI